MRKIFYILAGIAAFALMASCNKEAHPVVPSGEKVTATFTVQLPDGVATKAISDGMTAKELLFMAYDQNGNHLNLDQTVTVGSNFKATVNVNLVKGVKYQFVFWAQKAGQYTSGISTDKKTLTITPANMMNSDNWDAFYWHELLDEEVTGPFTKEITLRRPFAQINVGAPLTLDASQQRTAGDFYSASKSGIAIDAASLKTAYKLKLCNTLNLLTGAISGEGEVDMTLVSRPDEFLTVSETKYDYVAMAYVLAGDAEGAMVNTVELTLSTRQNGSDIQLSRSVANVPIRQNYRTNILGNVFTVEGIFQIIVSPMYAGEMNITE